jgi:hypothetical protein
MNGLELQRPANPSLARAKFRNQKHCIPLEKHKGKKKKKPSGRQIRPLGARNFATKNIAPPSKNVRAKKKKKKKKETRLADRGVPSQEINGFRRVAKGNHSF